MQMIWRDCGVINASITKVLLARFAPAHGEHHALDPPLTIK